MKTEQDENADASSDEMSDRDIDALNGSLDSIDLN